MAGRLLISAAAVLPFAFAFPSSLQPRQTCTGVKGFDKGTPAIGYYAVPVYATPSGCAAKCRAVAGCAMFAISATECLVYSTTVETNVTPNPESAYSFYNLACFSATPPPSSLPAAISPALCGASGWDKQTPRWFYTTIDANSTVGGIERARICAEQCKTMPNLSSLCKVYGVYLTTTCVFYALPFVSGGGTGRAPYVTNLLVDPASGWTFYDRSCPLTGSLYPACNTIEGCVEGRICTVNGSATKYQQYCDAELDPLDAAVYLFSKTAATSAPQARMPGWIVDACAAACEANPECKSVRLLQPLGSASVQCRLVKTAAPRYLNTNGERDLYQVLTKLA